MGMLKKYTNLLLIATCAITAHGAGYQIIEQGAANLGNAMAGAAANANSDASAAFWNPSTAFYMGLGVGETRMDTSVFFVIPKLCFVNDGKTNPGIVGGSSWNGNCATNSVVPNFFAVHRLSEDFALSFSVTAPYGLESDYRGDWIGRMQGIRSYLYTTDFNPSIAYKVCDWFTISGGVSAQFAYCTLSQTAAQQVGSMYFPFVLDLTGQGWSVGGNIGFTIQYCETGRFGFQWRSAVDYTLDGNAHSNGSNIIAPISADMSMPDTFTMGVYQRLGGDFSNFALMLDYCYTRWSVFQQLDVKGLGSDPIRENWKDTSRISFGIHYYPDFIENLTLRIGTCFDESPVRSPTDRTARIPCCDRVWLSTGIGYTYENYSIDISYTYIFLVGDSTINRYEPSFGGSQVSGSYFGHINVVAVQFGYKF